MPKIPPQRTPLWTGPNGDGPYGGVTQSLMGDFLQCPMRFKLYYVDGLASADGFSHQLEFGSMFHLAIETYLRDGANLRNNSWREAVRSYAKRLCERYQTNQENIDHWYNVVCVTFIRYVEYWKDHKSNGENHQSLLQEMSFDIPYQLPSGRRVRLRGKCDGVEARGVGKDRRIWLNETKTKGEINELAIERLLAFDLQTMMYLVALETYQKTIDLGGPEDPWRSPIGGVKYDVILRPLSGGKGSIRRKKPTKTNPNGESKVAFYDRLGKVILDSPHEFFMRWNVVVAKHDLERFLERCLHPLLEQLLLWYDVVALGKPSYALPENCINYQRPHGVVSWLDRTSGSEYDEYLASGSTLGLTKIDSLFGELTT